MHGQPDNINTASGPEEGRAPRQDRRIWQGAGLLDGETLLHSAVPVTDSSWLLELHIKLGLAEIMALHVQGHPAAGSIHALS